MIEIFGEKFFLLTLFVGRKKAKIIFVDALRTMKSASFRHPNNVNNTNKNIHLRDFLS